MSKPSSSNGPDWTDVGLIMLELETLHEVSVSLVMSHGGAQGSLLVCAVAEAKRNKESIGVAMRSVSRRHRIAASNHDSLAPAIYRLLVELDYDCSAMWRQTRIQTEKG